MNSVALLSAGGDITLGEAALDLVLGLLIVFVVLAVLIGVIYLLKAVFALFAKAAKEEAQPTVNSDIVDAAKACEPNADEIAAVIAAVTSLYYEDVTKNAKCAPFKVKNIYRVK